MATFTHGNMEGGWGGGQGVPGVLPFSGHPRTTDAAGIFISYPKSYRISKVQDFLLRIGPTPPRGKGGGGRLQYINARMCVFGI